MTTTTTTTTTKTTPTRTTTRTTDYDDDYYDYYDCYDYYYYYYYYSRLTASFCRRTWVSRYLKGKTSLDSNEARHGGVLVCSGNMDHMQTRMLFLALYCKFTKEFSSEKV